MREPWRTTTSSTTRAGTRASSGAAWTWASASEAGGPRLSIGLKIFTVALIVLVLMGAVTALTATMAASVNRELEVLAHGYIEANEALARVNILSLERSLYNRRMYINARDGEER